MPILTFAWCVLTSIAAQADPPDSRSPVVTTDHGQAVRELVAARPFTLEESYRYRWTQEKPPLASGLILVLKVDPDYVRPREIHAPVLYVGETPAERTNVGFESGHVVIIVPGAPDLATTPIYFGSVELPERVDAERGRRELSAALERGVRPFSRDSVAQAFARGGEVARVKDSTDLYLVISDLILIHAPDETERAERYRMAPTRPSEKRG